VASLGRVPEGRRPSQSREHTAAGSVLGLAAEDRKTNRKTGTFASPLSREACVGTAHEARVACAGLRPKCRRCRYGSNLHIKIGQRRSTNPSVNVNEERATFAFGPQDRRQPMDSVESAARDGPEKDCVMACPNRSASASTT
jgi:hypothetical protein